MASKIVVHELRHLHDVLTRTALADRYWLWGGVILGWAREGRILAHDTADVDFAYRASDTDRLRQAVPVLEAAGFRLQELGRNSKDDVVTHFSFIRSGIRFDFLGMFEVNKRFHVFEYHDGIQVTLELPILELEPIEMFGRQWRKVRDHETELTLLYGDWRTPKPDWDVLYDCPAVIEKVPRTQTPNASSQSGS